MIQTQYSCFARAFAFAASSLMLACAHRDEAVGSASGVAPRVRMIATTPGVRLEVIDWGGKGPPLVFLAGLGNTAHVFDDFAPQFTDRFHVVGITRRGFGASSATPPPASLDTLVADLRTVLDSLGIPTATIVGHSIAGEEMTQFAERFPGRCAGLVYLDAAYDRTRTMLANQPTVPQPRVRPKDFASFANVKALYQRVMGIVEPDADIRATTRFDASGTYRGEITSGAMKARAAKAVAAPRYDAIRCPALAIYAAPDSLADVVPYYRELDAVGRARGDTLLTFVAAVVAQAHAQFESSGHRATDIRGNHYLFLQHPREVAAAMRTFLQDSGRSFPPNHKGDHTVLP